MARGSFFNRLTSALTTSRTVAKPYSEQGVAGFSHHGGYVQVPEKNADVAGANRWHTAADILTNISIVAASLRYSLNLISRPAWRADPPSDTAEAKAMAEWVEEVLNGADTSWSRIVRRSGTYRYHGFNLQEWVAKKRDDGKIGIQSIEPRPVHTITKWDLDENGGVLGVIQTSPQTGQEVYLPRSKLVYLVDDALTDRPDGMGWFRHLADPAQRLRRYLRLETMGFERDLAGIPVGRAPLQRINQLVKEGKLTENQAGAMISAMEDFVRIQVKEPSTGLLLDSEPFRAKGDTGETISGVMQWGLELLTASPGSAADLGNAIYRLMTDMAMIMGTEQLLVGTKGEGSRALSEDKSRNLYLTSNAALTDMAEAYDRDIVTPLWAMNGFDDELRPKLKTEDVSFKDAESIAKALAEMAAAGAILHPNDPAINDLRDLMGISLAPPVDEATADLMLGAKAGVRPQQDDQGGSSGPGDGGRPSRENPEGSGGQPKENPSGGRGAAKKTTLRLGGFDESKHPRDERGRWTNASADVSWPNPLNERERLFNDETNTKIGGITVRDTPDGWHISDLRAITRGGGRETMQQVVDLADEHGKQLSLFAIPMPSPAGKQLSKQKLINWYKSFGFVETDPDNPDSDYMTRPPMIRKYDPDEPRDEDGKWTDGGVPGGKKPRLSMFDRIRNDPRVESIDDYRPDGLFVSLKPGYSWSGQRSFGTETVSEAYRLLRQVEERSPEEQEFSNLGKYDPSEPRDYHGRWTDGSISADALPGLMKRLGEHPDQHPNIIGLEVDGKKIFSPEKSLGLTRMEMPAIPGADRAAFLKTVPFETVSVDPRALGPTQSELDGFKVSSMANAETQRAYGFAPMVSSDGYVMDGHHNWAGSVVRAQLDPNERLTVNRVKMDRQSLLPRMRSYADEHGFRSLGMAKYSPDQPRDPAGTPTGGQWTSTGAIPLTRELKKELVKRNIGKSVGQMRAEAIENQKALDVLGNGLEEEGLISYEPPPPGYEVKTEASVIRKMRDEGYAGPHEITDYSRASFVIDDPREASQVINKLSERGTVYDKGWQYLERAGYLDRKVYLQHPNGGFSEIQITPRGVFQIKMGQGHRLYEVARLPSTPREVASAALRKSRNLYAKAISNTEFRRFALRGRH